MVRDGDGIVARMPIKVALAAHIADDMTQLILMAHVFFGVACVLASGWVFVDTLNVRDTTLGRIRLVSRIAAVFMWLNFLAGGYWYVVFYKVDKAIILKAPRPWPLAHNFFMETKEHLVITLLLLVTYLPIAAANNLAANRDARRLVLFVAAAGALLALFVEGEGAVIALGVKTGVLAQTTLNRHHERGKQHNSVSKCTISFGWSLALCSVLNALLVVAKEKSPKLQGTMKSIAGHHWIAHSAIVVLLFVVFGWLFASAAKNRGPNLPVNSLIKTIFAGLTVGVVIIVGFYLFAD